MHRVVIHHWQKPMARALATSAAGAVLSASTV
jgi:hypothetical protein